MVLISNSLTISPILLSFSDSNTDSLSHNFSNSTLILSQTQTLIHSASHFHDLFHSRSHSRYLVEYSDDSSQYLQILNEQRMSRDWTQLRNNFFKSRSEGRFRKRPCLSYLHINGACDALFFRNMSHSILNSSRWVSSYLFSFTLFFFDRAFRLIPGFEPDTNFYRPRHGNRSEYMKGSVENLKLYSLKHFSD